jgi:hypothetical protein
MWFNFGLCYLRHARMQESGRIFNKKALVKVEIVRPTVIHASPMKISNWRERLMQDESKRNNDAQCGQRAG